MPRDKSHRWAVLLMSALAVGAGAGCASASIVPRRCPFGLQGSFLQLTDQQLGYGAAEWAETLQVLRATGASSVIVQFTGDATSAYEDRDVARGRAQGPVGALLGAAETAGVDVYLGLHADPRWPSDAAASGLPPPLDDPPVAAALGRMCRESAACAGWYLSGEIDDQTWAGTARTQTLRGYLRRTSAILRGLTPGRPVVVAPFFTGNSPPDVYARWWAQLLVGRPVDVVALQDGVGTGRATPERAAEYLRALGPVTAYADVRLWSVIELFEQLHGPSVDGRPFAARPAAFATVRRSLEVQRPLVEQAVGFSVLDYMHPHGSRGARALFDQYVDWCDRAAAPTAAPTNQHQPAVSAADIKNKKGT